MISVVIPTYNRRERLHRVLTSLAGQDIGEPFEVVVVSDGSTDGTDEYLRSDAVPIEVAAHRHDNQGPAATRNRGFQAARGDLIVFLDDDVVAHPSLLRTHSDAHRDRDDLVTIGPMLDPHDHPMSPWVQWEQTMLTKQYDAMRDGIYEATAKQFYTGNAAIRRHHLVAVGGFDPSFRRAEDIELAYRLADRGITFEFCRDAIGYHYAERSFASWRETAYVYGRNDIVFARDRNQQWIFPFIGEKFAEHRAPIRGLVRVTASHARLAAAAVVVLSKAALVADKLRLPQVARYALSGAYAVEYHRGVADEAGDATEFRRLIRPSA